MLNSTAYLYFVLLVAASGTAVSTSTLPTIVMSEEARVNTIVGSLTTLLPTGRVLLPIRADQISNDFDKNFVVLPNGSIVVSSRIDLDELSACPEPSTNDSTCCKTYTIMVGDASSWPKFRICVVDVNEFVPTFFDASQNVSAVMVEQAENEKNQRVAIRLSLKDNDFSGKKWRSFTFFLANNTDNDTRSLFGSHLSSSKPTNVTISSDNFMLKLARSLDREVRSVYNFTLVACEPMNLSRCGHLNVTLKVNDENDNEPQFAQSEYTFNLNESAAGAHEYEVGYVHALDIDSSEHANTQYETTEAHCDEPNNEEFFDNHLFQVDQRGRITVSNYAGSELLDFEQCRRVTFLIRAWDQHRPERNEERSTARVFVNILNADDAPPKIKFEMKEVYIMENQENFSNALPVRIVVDDPDSSKGDLNCRNEAHFQTRLQKSASSGTDALEFVLYVTERLDREKQPEVQITIVCTDLARNQNSLVLTVTVLDENDNWPVFDQVTDRLGASMAIRNNRTEVSVPESEQVQTFVARLNALDKDVLANGEVEYAFLHNGLATNRSGRFEIDAQNGEIMAYERFDREQTETFNLVVAAIDRGKERRTSTISLVVRVDDENDNPPQFTESNYYFRVNESSELESDDAQHSALIGRLNVSDRDTKGHLVFSMVNESNRFSVNERGELFANAPLDREVAEHYWFTVQVSDGLHAEVANVHVELIDRDDKLPEFIFPSRPARNYTAQFECPADQASANREFFVAQLSAIDRDGDPAHRQIAYALVDYQHHAGMSTQSKDPAARKLFRVDEGGRVWYLRSSSCVVGSFELTVEAFRPNNSNQSRAVQRTEARLLVVVTESQSQSQFAPDGSASLPRNVNSKDSLANERDAASGGIGLPQLLIALAIGAVVVVIAILVLLVIVARLNHREHVRTAQRTGAPCLDRKRQRRKMMEANSATLRQCVTDDAKHHDETDGEFDEDDALPSREDEDAASCVRHSPTYSNSHAHIASMSTSTSTSRRNYLYHPVASHAYQLATLTNNSNNNNNSAPLDQLVRHTSCGSVCSACAASPAQHQPITDDRYHILLRAADEYDTAVDDANDLPHGECHVSLARDMRNNRNQNACACNECMVMQNRSLPEPWSQNEYGEREASVRLPDDAARSRYASLGATVRREARAATIPERLYVHQSSNSSCFSRTDTLVNRSAESALATRCAHAECDNSGCCATKLGDAQLTSVAIGIGKAPSTQQSGGAHGTISFV